MDEQIIRTLQEQAIEERQYIQEKYGQDEDVVQEIIDLANVVEEGGTLKAGESLN